MKTTRRWLGIICLLAALIAIVWWLSGPETVVRLSDGTTLRLLGVTTGTNYFTTERSWHPMARKILPFRFQHLIPQPKRAMWGFLNGATYWFDLHDRTNGLIAPAWGRAETISSDGDILESHCSPSYGSQEFFGIGMDCFPRRERTFRYRIYDTNKSLLGGIRLPSPFPGPFPNWKPDALPIIRTNGDLTVTLTKVRKLLDEYPAGKTNIHFRESLEFRWKGLPTTNWERGPSFLDDATGNSIGWLHTGLPRSEKVWRWRVWMERRKDAPFAPEERFVITNLPVPAAGSWTLLNITTNIQGLEFWIGCWAGPSTLTLSNGYPFQIALPLDGEDWRELAWGSSSGAFIKTNIIKRPTLIASIRENGIETRAEVTFRNQDGRPLARDYDPRMPDGVGYMMLRPGGSSIESRYYRPVMDDRVRSVSLEVTVQRRPEMHFFIAPPAEGEWIGRRPNPPAK